VFIDVQLSGSALYTTRSLNNSFLMYVMTLVGSVFGMMQLFSMGMNIGEKTEEMLANKIKKVANIEDLTKRRNWIAYGFEYEYICPNRKNYTEAYTDFEIIHTKRQKKVFPDTPRATDITTVHEFTPI
jgi:hypothetical protein